MNKQEEARHMALATLAAAPSPEQLVAPLDYVFAEHFRQRTLCWMIDRIADEQKRDEEGIAAVLRFLRHDFGQHVVDEEEDLFPLLRRRAEPEDRIEEVLGELSQEHAADKQDADAITEGLSQAIVGKRFTKALRALLHRFAANERRHLIVENAIVLPLARVRLTGDDLRNLGRRMAARRGIDYPDMPHAV
ncbi:hemerythrin domain-containing protein [Oricola nitratireducens]|uniref:hemerythrin domain-containing protein n=1 Tax=Oricola nitratireducens TaxID=2775868 RepID=UPI001AEE4DB7